MVLALLIKPLLLDKDHMISVVNILGVYCFTVGHEIFDPATSKSNS